MDKVGNAVTRDVSGAISQPQELPKQDPLPKIYEETVVSSASPPSSPALRDQPFLSSDFAQGEESPLSSPPSSPPEELPSPVVGSRKPTFSLLKRSKTFDHDPPSHRPLSEVAANARKLDPARSGKMAMTQTKIDLGGDIRRTCRTCGMEYIPSVKEDAELHKDFCGMNLDGINLGKSLLKDESLRRGFSVIVVEEKNEKVLCVGRRCSLGVKKQVKRVLQSVNTELSAADVHADILWESCGAETSDRQISGKRKANQHQESNGDRFKAFLYLIGDRCVGFCLAEKISNAYPVIDEVSGGGEADGAAASSSLSVSDEAKIALLGISRIWTSRSFRDRGIATRLLESARLSFFYGVQVPKHLVAFSQPTESGGRLAKKWFGVKAGWSIYRGDR